MDLYQKVEAVISECVRPHLQSHGGDIRIVSLDDQQGRLEVQLIGVCSGCPSADLETRDFLNDTICVAVPEVHSVELVHLVEQDMVEFARRILNHEPQTLKRAIKFCGGCNPRYDREKVATQLEKHFGQPLPYAQKSKYYDVLYVICGCSARCADISELNAKQIIMIDSDKLSEFV